MCVAWHGFVSGVIIEAEEIYLSCSADLGASWGKPVNVSNSPSTISIRPTLVAGSDGTLHVAWQELAGDDPLEEYEVYYAHSFPNVTVLPIVMR
jgi:hypothetical protein